MALTGRATAGQVVRQIRKEASQGVTTGGASVIAGTSGGGGSSSRNRRPADQRQITVTRTVFRPNGLRDIYFSDGSVRTTRTTDKGTITVATSNIGGAAEGLKTLGGKQIVKGKDGKWYYAEDIAREKEQKRIEQLRLDEGTTTERSPVRESPKKVTAQTLADDQAKRKIAMTDKEKEAGIA